MWVRKVGSAPKKGLFERGPLSPVGQTPLLCVHSGPGLSSRYMETIEFLGLYRQVAFYDQSGCGNSSAVNGGSTPGARTLQASVDELAAVAAALAGDRKGNPGGRVHVLGHGLGGMLALEAVAQGKLSPASLTLVGTPLSYGDLVADRRACLELLPAGDARALREADAADALVTGEGGRTFRGAQAAPEFARYAQSHLARRSRSGCLTFASGDCEAGVYDVTGGRYFEEAGTARGWSAAGRLAGAAGVPALLVRGTRDELSRESVDRLQAELGPGAQRMEMENAGSAVFVDDWEVFLERVKEHCDAADESGAA